MQPTRIDERFESLRRQGKKGFIAFITAGDPSLKGTVDIVLRLEEAGVDIVELGIPFSDPLADGEVNQFSAARALEQGTTPGGVIDCVATLREKTDIPLLCYSYLNPMIARGFDTMVKKAARNGLDGLLLLDLPVEESAEYTDVLSRHGLNNICLVTPTSPNERVKRIVNSATGFVYCVSREGVTGMQKQIAGGAQDLLRRTSRHTRLPIALGFGVSNPQQARAAVHVADAVVVGSAIVKRFNDEAHNAAGRKKAAAWVKKLVRAVKEV